MIPLMLFLGCSQPQPIELEDTYASQTTSSPSLTTSIPDPDNDGYEGEEDCAPDDPDIHPFAGDSVGDGVDSDCDGLDCEAFWSDDLLAYFIVCPDAMGWADAAAFCSDHGTLLASIRTVDEQRVLTETITALKGIDQAWFGFTDQEVEGGWRWVDDATTAYTAWGSNQPDNAGNADCAQLGFQDTLQWNDVSCETVFDTRGLICNHRVGE